MKVIAIADGYYNRQIRKTGDVFDVPEGETASWFVAVEEPQPEKPEKKGKKEDDSKPA